jgi:PPK2 family polyphosphate:nucleotide phosphotransferase
MAADIARIDELQDILYAQAKHALLCVFQAMDAGGKDGTMRTVFGPIDPLGLLATSFKKPSERELSQDYLWRVHQAVPARGMIGLFNRSHYEDVLVVRVHGWAPPDAIERRYDQINAFEKHLTENDVTILKFFLHVSKEEQRERLQARIDDPRKRWKFNSGDLSERKLWSQYMQAYEIALRRCSTAWAPWHVIPADHNWYRNAVVARIVRATLEGLDLKYPVPSLGTGRIVVR